MLHIFSNLNNSASASKCQYLETVKPFLSCVIHVHFKIQGVKILTQYHLKLAPISSGHLYSRGWGANLDLTILKEPSLRGKNQTISIIIFIFSALLVHMGWQF